MCELFASIVTADHRSSRKHGNSAGWRIQAEDFRPDVVLCDLAMPGVDGCKVAESLHHHAEFSPVSAEGVLITSSIFLSDLYFHMFPIYHSGSGRVLFVFPASILPLRVSVFANENVNA
jgi:hypothetical protein